MKCTFTAATAAVVIFLGAGSLFAGAVANVSATPNNLSIVQGAAGQFSVSLDELSGSVPPKANNAPTISYCSEWTIHTDGTATCDDMDTFTLSKGRNYTQAPVLAGEYAGAVVVNVDAGAPCKTLVTLTETFTAQNGSGVDFGDGDLKVSSNVAVAIWCAPQTATDIGGCGHGYWKNHVSEWPAAYNGNTTLESVFDLRPFRGSLRSTKFTDALEFKGGNTAQEKAQILLRNAVAALLNASKTQVTYQYSTAQVISNVNAALASKSKTAMLALEQELDLANRGSAYCGDEVK